MKDIRTPRKEQILQRSTGECTWYDCEWWRLKHLWSMALGVQCHCEPCSSHSMNTFGISIRKDPSALEGTLRLGDVALTPTTQEERTSPYRTVKGTVGYHVQSFLFRIKRNKWPTGKWQEGDILGAIVRVKFKRLIQKMLQYILAYAILNG